MQMTTRRQRHEIIELLFSLINQVPIPTMQYIINFVQIHSVGILVEPVLHTHILDFRSAISTTRRVRSIAK